jgi:hypothetical protein
VFVGDPNGRCIAYGGRRRLANGRFEVLDDIWYLYGTAAADDSTHGWSLMEQVGDPSLPAGQNLPGARWGAAATWAGVEDRADAQERENTGAVICYVHGGRNAAGDVLGDLWRGERRLVRGPHYQWAWKRLMAGSSTTRRFGHTMMFDPGAPGTAGAPRAKLLLYGGWRSRTQLNDPTKLAVIGVGAQSTNRLAWRELVPTGPIPSARAWHAMTPRVRDPNGEAERSWYVFGGESGASDSTATPVAPDVWQLERPDASTVDEDRFAWSKLTIAAAGPSGRSRPALGYNPDGDVLLVVGGDTTGAAVPGGQTNAMWTLQGIHFYDNATVMYWRQPYQRSFHPGPPPIAGMGLVAIGGGKPRFARSMERFSPTADSPAGGDCGPLFGQWQTVTRPDSESERPLPLYPNLFVLPDGRLFNAGPTMSRDPSRRNSRYKRFFDLQARRWDDPKPGDQVDSTVFGTSAMLRPGVILRAGSADGAATGETQWIDTDPHGPKDWKRYHESNGSHPPLLPRRHLNLTLLPTGDVLATGGVGSDDDVVGSAVRAPQIWNAERERWSDPDPAGGEALAPDPWIRNYHSTALLLPDARILTAGGEHPSPDNDQMSASVFEPPYLFRADGSYARRPGILRAPERLAYGRMFTLRLADPASVPAIQSVALMRPSAVTHGFDQGQRYVPLDFIALDAPPRLLVRAPADANLAPPGDYLLFVVERVATDAPRVPSVARWVRVTAGSFTPVDSADVTPPRGGIALALREAVACGASSWTLPVRLRWIAPADDDTLSISGSATGYDLRYTPVAGSPAEPGAPADFRAWTRVPTAPPRPRGSGEQATIAGLSTARWYRFGLRAIGDGADTSSVSRLVVTKPYECSGGAGSTGDESGTTDMPPGGAFAATEAVPTATMPRSENTTFPGVEPGVSSRDVVPIPGAPPLAQGWRRLYVREDGRRGLALDRISLAVAEHAPGEEVAATGDGVLFVGERRPASSVVDERGIERAAAPLAAGREPLYADSGSTLDVTLPPKADSPEDLLLLETSGGTERGRGISVESRGPAGLHPRRAWSTAAVRVYGATSVRLRFQDAVAVRFIGRLAGTRAVVWTAALRLARSTSGAGWLAEASAADGGNAIVPPGDTLSLGFADPPSPPGLERSWFLVLEGTPLQPGEATSLAEAALERASEGPALAFRLHQNIPNPFTGSTRIRFDLPVAAEVRFEVFDLQGRIVRRIEARHERGRHELEWDLLDGTGRRVSPGLYGYRLRAGSFEAERKLVVLP